MAYRRHSKSAQARFRVMLVSVCSIAVLLTFVLLIVRFLGGSNSSAKDAKVESLYAKLDVRKDLLAKNKYSRPTNKLKNVKKIVIHFTGIPGQDAKTARDSVEVSAKKTVNTAMSSHYIVDFDGSIIHCIPEDEIALSSGERNADSITVTYCHKDEEGSIGGDAYDGLVNLIAYLAAKYNLAPTDILRHSDVSKFHLDCPIYFTESEQSWDAFKNNVFLAVEMSE